MKQATPHSPLTQLTFEKKEEKQALYIEAIEHFKQGKISPESILLGKKFQKQINEGFVVNSSVRFVEELIGFGLFAEEPLLPGTFIGEYVGCVRQNNHHGEINPYLYSYPQVDRIGRNYVIDAKEGNCIRFVNHSYQPNLVPKYAFVDGFYHLILIALKKIEPETQFTYNYGKKYWLVREPPKNL